MNGTRGIRRNQFGIACFVGPLSPVRNQSSNTPGRDRPANGSSRFLDIGPIPFLECQRTSPSVHFYAALVLSFKGSDRPHLDAVILGAGGDRPCEGGIVERHEGTFNTELFSTLPGYTGSNVQKRPEDAEKEACLTLREAYQLLVRYIVDRYNQSIDARMGDQTRFQRWEARLIATPSLISERELDSCLMKKTRRSIYRGGYLQFENLTYRGENLEAYTSESQVKILHNWLDGKRSSRQSGRVVGESRTGKTFACDAYRLRHKPRLVTGQPPVVPVAYIQIPQECRSKELGSTAPFMKN